MTPDTSTRAAQPPEALSGTQETIDGRPALRFVRHLPHSVDRVWRAISEPAELDRWFVATPPWTPTAGEIFEAFGQSGRVPGRRRRRPRTAR